MGLEMLYVEPGVPWENGFAESFFNRPRDELLKCEEFENLAEARWFVILARMVAFWRCSTPSRSPVLPESPLQCR